VNASRRRPSVLRRSRLAFNSAAARVRSAMRAVWPQPNPRRDELIAGRPFPTGGRLAQPDSIDDAAAAVVRRGETAAGHQRIHVTTASSFAARYLAEAPTVGRAERRWRRRRALRRISAAQTDKRVSIAGCSKLAVTFGYPLPPDSGRLSRLVRGWSQLTSDPPNRWCLGERCEEPQSYKCWASLRSAPGARHRSAVLL